MTVESPFAATPTYRPRSLRSYRGTTLPAVYSTPAEEWQIARTGAGVCDRSDRGWIEVCGNDRAAWLHNLVTNAVRTLDPGQGNYAFACDLKGRVQFDLNILAGADRLALDVDAEAIPAILAHFDRYLITEDVRVKDHSAELERIGVLGPRAAAIAEALGVTQFPALPDLAHFDIDSGVRFIKHAFAGGSGFELGVPLAHAPGWWERVVAAGAEPIGFDVMDALRIEAGIPWLGRDIDGKVLPAETGQIERGISYHKGCYLGQEVVERMRAYGSMARRLMRVTCDEAADLELPATLKQGTQDVGRVTSLVPHPLGGRWIGLAYVKTALQNWEGLTAGEPPHAVIVRDAFDSIPRGS